LTAIPTARSEKGSGSPAQAWLRALEMTAPIARHPARIFPTVIRERAAQFGTAPALLSERECLTYGELAARANRYARWALAQGLGKGETVALLMPNRPEYLAIWLGITQVGGVVALLNTNLTGLSLAHSINITAVKHVIVADEFADRIIALLQACKQVATVWIHGGGPPSFRRLDWAIEQYSAENLNDDELRPVTIEDRALYIYTSGTTGLPKAANVTHGRLMQSSHWFCGMMSARPTDRIYSCLPMYHSVGGVQVPGALLAGGGSVVIREKFSASNFWHDTVRWECTLIQYIGELCRYLLQTETTRYDTAHQVRMACGNGLALDIWQEFQGRFQIPQIFEFYGSTEGNVTLFNIEGEPGAIGRIPSYLAHRFPARLVQFDFDKGEPVRNDHGFCTTCAPNEVGEAIGEILRDSSNVGSRFDGYTPAEASEAKILRGAFQPGDAWFRTGDLMRKDERGFFHFVDRIGDTFRWKGENVATSEVSEALCAFAGIKQANVYGVEIPGVDGRAGMATLVADAGLDLDALRAHLASRLPEYAQPVFLRIRNQMELSATFKSTKTDLVRQGYDLAATADPIYFNDPEQGAFVHLDETLYQRIKTGEFHSRSPRSTNSERRRSHSASLPELANGAETRRDHV
jgi:fatty-acyl-CoA synthase